MPKTLEIQKHIGFCQKFRKSCQLIVEKDFIRAQKLLKSIFYQFSCSKQIANCYYLLAVCFENLNKSQLAETFRKIALDQNQIFYKCNQQNISSICKILIQLYDFSLQQFQQNKLSINDWLKIVKRFEEQRDYNSTQYYLKLYQQLKNQKQQIDDQTLSHFGLKYYEIGKYDLAIEKYKLAIKISPNDAMYYHNISMLYLLLQKYPQSEEYETKSLQIDPDRPNSFYIQSFIYQKTGRLEQSLSKVKSAIQTHYKQLVYRLRAVVLILSQFPNRQQQAKKYIAQSLLFIQNKQISRNVNFKGKQLFPSIFKFLQKSISDINNDRQRWLVYLQLVNGYLVHGSRQKQKIKKNIQQFQRAVEQMKNKIYQPIQMEIN